MYQVAFCSFIKYTFDGIAIGIDRTICVNNDASLLSRLVTLPEGRLLASPANLCFLPSAGVYCCYCCSSSIRIRQRGAWVGVGAARM